MTSLNHGPFSLQGVRERTLGTRLLCELRQIHATDFASEVSLTAGIVFIRVTCKLFEFIAFLYSCHVTFQIWS